MTALRELHTPRLRGAAIAEPDRAFYRAIWQDPAVVRTLGGPRTLAHYANKVRTSGTVSRCGCRA